MTTRDISEHLKGAYMGVDISPTLISNVTEKILSEVTQWQSRPLDALYPVIFFDAIHYKVREDHKIHSKAAYVCLGISKSGHKDVLGIYIGENESSTFWLSVLTDLQTRGIQDILIASIDGLKGFPEAIRTIFPKTEIQTSIVHQIRNSLRYVGSKYQKEFMRHSMGPLTRRVMGSMDMAQAVTRHKDIQVAQQYAGLPAEANRKAVNDVFDYLDNLERSSVSGDGGKSKMGLRLVVSDE